MRNLRNLRNRCVIGAFVTELRNDITELRNNVAELRNDVTELRSHGGTA